jgi:hypothetical protein
VARHGRAVPRQPRGRWCRETVAPPQCYRPASKLKESEEKMLEIFFNISKNVLTF